MRPLREWIRLARLVARKPPAHVARRLAEEIRHEIDRFRVPSFGRRFDESRLLAATGATDLDQLWERLLTAPGWPFHRWSADVAAVAVPDAERERVLAAAGRAVRHEIDLLGSGQVLLGERIDWERDYKTGHRWPGGYFRGIDYVNRGRPSDVKTAWELSRLQWLLPAAQAYVMTRDERFAAAARDVLEQWIDANPFACNVNWCVTMEPAMRVFTLAWLLMALGRSAAWTRREFRLKLLVSLYLHAWFTERFIERIEVNGNHFTADAAALVLAGALFGPGEDARRWLRNGRDELEREIRLQVHDDGVDFEASAAYHRLVGELFLFAGMAADAAGSPVSQVYRDRIAAMARFTAAYTGPDGLAPLWGDADDARTLPLGGQPLRDHRYFVALAGRWLQDAELAALAGGAHSEVLWLLGPQAAAAQPAPAGAPCSQAFPSGGVYVLRGECDHVFIDCGGIGLKGRGGHGHNDCLSFEACLAGARIVAETGCFVYTADFAARNFDRSTEAHNTPQIDGQELNRFLAPEILWLLHDDARPDRCQWRPGTPVDEFSCSHTGYIRLLAPARPVRRFRLDRERHALEIEDRFEGGGVHEVRIPLHLAPGVEAVAAAGGFRLQAEGRALDLRWHGAGAWHVEVGVCQVGESYGRRREATRLCWRAAGDLGSLDLTVVIQPAAD